MSNQALAVVRPFTYPARPINGGSLELALPKPGHWMETLKQLMGFVLLGTVVYLFSTINKDYFIATLALVMKNEIASRYFHPGTDSIAI